MAWIRTRQLNLICNRYDSTSPKFQYFSKFKFLYEIFTTQPQFYVKLFNSDYQIDKASIFYHSSILQKYQIWFSDTLSEHKIIQQRSEQNWSQRDFSLTLKALGFFLRCSTGGYFPPPLCKIRSRHPRKLKFTGLIAYIMFYKTCKFESLTIINDVIITSLPKTKAKFGILH